MPEGHRRPRGWLTTVPALAWAVLFAMTPVAEAAVLRGLKYILVGLFELPRGIVAGTFGGPPILGTVWGGLAGTFSGLNLMARGAIDLVSSAVAIGLKVAPLIPIFL